MRGNGPRGAILLTSEHESATVPARYAHLFQSRRARNALNTHRGSDLGTKRLAGRLGRALAPLPGWRVHGPIRGQVTRLLVDLNRSQGHPTLFSEFSERLPEHERRALLHRYYAPHHGRVRAALATLLGDAPFVLHLGVHSFTPVLARVVREADIGILYDPRRARERSFALALQRALTTLAPELRVRRNYPYHGRSDGLTTLLRKDHPDARYLGVELELNQGILRGHEVAFASLLGLGIRRALDE